MKKKFQSSKIRLYLIGRKWDLLCTRKTHQYITIQNVEFNHLTEYVILNQLGCEFIKKERQLRSGLRY